MSATNYILCFGELLLRFSPKMNGQFIRDASMPVFVGGAELNVATALSNWGVRTKYQTALPDNYLSAEIIDYIQSKQINPSVYFKGERIGSYILPQGKDLKNTAVIYDRNYSAFSELKPGEINWEMVFEDCIWFHFSAISPALNKNTVEVCKEALHVARSKGIKISIDLNYRERLWKYGVSPSQIMPQLVQYCNVIMGNIWAAEKLLSISIRGNYDQGTSKEAYSELAHLSAEEIMKFNPNCSVVANTFRFDREPGIDYFACLTSSNAHTVSETYQSNKVIDKVGSGDCFMAGLIYGILQGKSHEETVNFASAAAINKLNQEGDASNSSLETIMQTVSVNG